MRSSHHFMIGNSHEVCEDYAFSEGDFAALSDGCSRVSRPDGSLAEAHTDVGARLLVRAAFACRSEPLGLSFLHTAIRVADAYRRSLQMASETLSATLICLAADDNIVTAAIAGDGMVAARRRDTRKWEVYASRFSGPPFYPRYLLEHGQIEDRWAKESTVTFLADGTRQHCVPFIYGFPGSFCDLVVAASDGVFSFTERGKPVEFNYDFALRLLDFRRMGGKFMVRHLRGTLENLKKDGLVNQDDISMVGLYID